MAHDDVMHLAIIASALRSSRRACEQVALILVPVLVKFALVFNKILKKKVAFVRVLPPPPRLHRRRLRQTRHRARQLLLGSRLRHLEVK